jgi:hypothetical protein
MPIKLKSSGAVILKNGKVSCECCGCSGPTEGRNVFQITKLEYEAYLKGGIWTLVSYFSESESTSDGKTSFGEGSINVSGFTEGCSGRVAGVGTAYVQYNGAAASNYDIRCSINYELGRRARGYFVKFTGTSHEATSEIESSYHGYPSAVNIVIGGRLLEAYGTWGPGWRGDEGYQNTSSSTLTAIFTPT